MQKEATASIASMHSQLRYPFLEGHRSASLICWSESPATVSQHHRIEYNTNWMYLYGQHPPPMTGVQRKTRCDSWATNSESSSDDNKQTHFLWVVCPFHGTVAMVPRFYQATRSLPSLSLSLSLLFNSPLSNATHLYTDCFFASPKSNILVLSPRRRL